MSLQIQLTCDEIIKYITSRVSNYSETIKQFSDFKFNNCDKITFIKFDNYAITNITIAYYYDDLVQWAAINNIELVEFKI